MDKATEYVRSKIQAGDNYIIGGDFNMDYDSGGYFIPYGEEKKHYCPADQSFTQLFDVSCSTNICHYMRELTPHKDGVADYILGGKDGHPRMYQYCYLDNWGMWDAHPMLVGTVQMP